MYFAISRLAKCSAVLFFTLLAAGCSVRSDSEQGAREKSGTDADTFSTVAEGLATEAGGSNYVDLCRDKGVPVPDQVFSESWTFWGDIPGQSEFSLPELVADIWSWKPSSPDRPDGICVANPRYDDGVSTITGMICMGYQSSKVCSFDSQEPVYRGTEPGEPTILPISAFQGGAELPIDRGASENRVPDDPCIEEDVDVCSDCHAGRNPFVIHPQKTLEGQNNPLDDLKTNRKLMPNQWHDPIVKESWPDNPGPIPKLPPVSGDTQSCSSGTCHNQSSRGRFPTPVHIKNGSPEKLDLYCCDVLRPALNGTFDENGNQIAEPTMPLGGKRKNYTHDEWLLNKCKVAGDGSGTTTSYNPPSESSVVSAPTVVGPVWKCTNRVTVTGLLPGADVTLYVEEPNSSSNRYTDTKSAGERSRLTFTVPEEFREDEEIKARQSVGNLVSAKSDGKLVGDYLAEVSNPPPAPTIKEPIHQCGTGIAFQAINGANVDIDVAEEEGGTIDVFDDDVAGNFTYVVRASSAFSINDQVIASQSICEESSSNDSVYVSAAPSSLSEVEMQPKKNYAGQGSIRLRGITPSAAIGVGLASEPQDFDQIDSWPLRWKSPYYITLTSLGRPLEKGDELEFQPELCDPGPTTTGQPVEGCEELPAPEIARPYPGDQVIIVTGSAPKARIRVFDGNGNELGNGRAPRVTLTSPLADGDTVYVVQQLEDCISDNARTLVVTDGEDG